MRTPIRLRASLAATLLATGALVVPLLATPGHAGVEPVSERPRGTKVVGGFSATYVASGTPVTVTGKVRDKGRKKRVVLLEQKIAGGWHTVERTRTRRSGDFTMGVPTHWFYSSKMRLRVIKNRRSGGDVSGAERVSSVPGYAALGSPDAWAYIDRPKVRANPCRTITYGINSAGALPDPASAATAIHHSVALASQATGIRFRFTGETSAMPFDRKHRKRDPELVFGWIADSETRLDLGPSVAARGGADRARWARDARGRRIVEAVTMGVIYDAEEPYVTAEGMYHVTMHELGHALGLGHVPAVDQHMTAAPEGYDLPSVYSAGDLAGLAKVGLQAGCLRPFRGGRHRLAVPLPPVLD